MAGNDMWFGTLERMQFVPAPLATSEFSNVGWAANDTLLNGGGWARTSWTSHKEFGLNWGMQLREKTQAIKNYRDGLMGDGPFYFVDPMAANINLFPAWWAAPMMGCLDAPPLVYSLLPEKVLTPANNHGFPIYSAKYTQRSSAWQGQVSVTLPIPPDAALNVGIHGSFVDADTSNLARINVVGIRAGNVRVYLEPMELLSVTSGIQTNRAFLGTDYVAVEFRPTVDPGASLTLSGMIAKLARPDQFVPAVEQSAYPFVYNDILYTDAPVDSTDPTVVLLDGTVSGDVLSVDAPAGSPAFPLLVNPVSYGPFAGGRGNSGVSFSGDVIEAPVGGRPDMSTIAAKFVETGGW